MVGQALLVLRVLQDRQGLEGRLDSLGFLARLDSLDLLE